ncbi:MAG: tryptophan-rich sensory protein [Gemmatimonadota bacterium]|nr:tryptophan-rich sensory protein [Gemmatimonadota bacterium]
MSTLRSLLGLAGWVALALAAGWIGSHWQPGPWYEGLRKPVWNPPAGVLGPVWTALYLLMGIAAWLVWRRRGFDGASGALSLFAVQLVLNAAWSWLFFGLRSPGGALVGILILWVAILAIVAAFARHHRIAAMLLFPYLAWVSFAAVLNFRVWQMNA